MCHSVWLRNASSSPAVKSLFERLVEKESLDEGQIIKLCTLLLILDLRQKVHRLTLLRLRFEVAEKDEIKLKLAEALSELYRSARKLNEFHRFYKEAESLGSENPDTYMKLR